MTDRTQPVKRETASGSVAVALTEMIVGNLAPGAQLPSEADLAERFDVSRLTVREAVKMLAGRGLLDLARGRRAVVREPDGSAFADFLAAFIREDVKGLFDLIELRMAIETMSARLAAKRANRAALQALEAAIQGMREAATANEKKNDAAAERRFHDFDLQFHETLAMASGNRVLAFLFEAMTKSLHEGFHMSRRGQRLRGANSDQTLAAHQAVLDAVRDGNGKAASDAMRAHLNNTLTDIRAYLNGG